MIAFTPENETKFQNLLTKYETKRSVLLPALHLAQEQWGFISPQVMVYLAGKLDIPPAHVYEVVAFYTMFRKKDMGKYFLQVCNNISCTIMGSEKIIAAVKEELGIGLNEMTPDQMFSLVPVQCLGSCDTAPVLQVNEDYFENLSPDTVKELIRKLKRGEKVPGQGERC